MTECKYAMKLGEDRFGQPDIRCSGTRELDRCPGFDKCHQYKPVCECETNEDWLKGLSKLGLARFMSTATGPCQYCAALWGRECDKDICFNAWIRWLGLEHKENE